MALKISLIAALDRNLAIGRGNALPWHLPDDLRRFKALTLGKPILMGARTALSLGRALPGRLNLVLTHQPVAPFAGMRVVASLEQAIDAARADAAADALCVIGGKSVFALALPMASALHLTWVDTVVEDADAFFPPFDPDRWQVTHRDPHPADARHAQGFEFVDYIRAT